jgi:hypothetical protein
MVRHSWLGTPLISVSQLATNGILIGTFVKLPYDVFPWDTNDGYRNTPLASAAWVLRWSSGKNNFLRLVLAVILQKTLAMCGFVKNWQFSLFGPSLCPL